MSHVARWGYPGRLDNISHINTSTWSPETGKPKSVKKKINNNNMRIRHFAKCVIRNRPFKRGKTARGGGGGGGLEYKNGRGARRLA